jgi:hypothetical protein
MAKDLNYLDEIKLNHILNLSAELGRVLNGLINSFRLWPLLLGITDMCLRLALFRKPPS